MNYKTIIIKALNCLIKNDSFLIENNLHEACITHKLAEYLQNLIPEFNVDCEYNRNIDDKKIVYTLEKTLEKEYFVKNFEKEILKKIIEQYKKEEKLVRPDIIVHLRGKNKNKIVIEAKKYNNASPENEAGDLAKLFIFTDENETFKYDIGYYIVFPKKFSDNPTINFKEIIENKVYKIEIN